MNQSQVKLRQMIRDFLRKKPTFITKNPLSEKNCLDLMQVVFKENRDKFIQFLVQAHSLYPSVLRQDYKNKPLIEQLCHQGSSWEVQQIAQLIGTDIKNYCRANPIHISLQSKMGGKILEDGISSEKIRCLLSLDKQLLTWNTYRSFVEDAFDKKKYRCALALVSKGADCQFKSFADQNLLHLLYNEYNNLNEDLFMELRQALLAQGVSENETDIEGKKPLDDHPELKRRLRGKKPKGKNKHKKSAQTQKVEQKTEVKAQEIIQEKVEEKIGEKVEEKIEEVIEEKVEEKIEEVIEEKVQNKIEQKIEKEAEESKISNTVDSCEVKKQKSKKRYRPKFQESVPQTPQPKVQENPQQKKKPEPELEPKPSSDQQKKGSTSQKTSKQEEIKQKTVNDTKAYNKKEQPNTQKQGEGSIENTEKKYLQEVVIDIIDKKRVLSSYQIKEFLDEELTDMVAQIEKQNSELHPFHEEFIKTVGQAISWQFDREVIVYGSYQVGLALPSSNIDLAIMIDKTEIWQKQKILQQISNYFQSSKFSDSIKKVDFIPSKNIPILKLQSTEKHKQKKIILSLHQKEEFDGVEMMIFLKKCLKKYPHLKTLTFALKQLIQKAGLAERYTGGLSGFTLAGMIIAYLQLNDSIKKKEQRLNETSASLLLISFLKDFGFKWDYIGKKICAIHPQVLEKLDSNTFETDSQPFFCSLVSTGILYLRDFIPPPKLIVIDPLNPKHNIGKATHQIRKLRILFQRALISLHTYKESRDKEKCACHRVKHERMGKQLFNVGPCCILKRMLSSSQETLFNC